MSIEKRLERLEAIVDARGLDWDHPRVEGEPAKEAEHPAGPKPDPGEGYRILSKDPPEELMPGDELQYINGTWVASDNARTHRRQGVSLWYRRKIEVAKEPEHPAGPKPNPGEGYRLLRKDPPEKLSPGDDFWFSAYAEWHKSFHATLGITSQSDALWFRRKIEQPKDEYREPVLPADEGKWCEFSIDGNAWTEAKLRGFAGHLWQSVCSEVVGAKHWVHARIKKDA